MRRTRTATLVLRSDPTGKLVSLGIPMTFFGHGNCPGFLGDGVIIPHKKYPTILFFGPCIFNSENKNIFIFVFNVRLFTTLQIVICWKISVWETWDISHMFPIWHKAIYVWLCSGSSTCQDIASPEVKKPNVLLSCYWDSRNMGPILPRRTNLSPAKTGASTFRGTTLKKQLISDSFIVYWHVSVLKYCLRFMGVLSQLPTLLPSVALTNIH